MTYKKICPYSVGDTVWVIGNGMCYPAVIEHVPSEEIWDDFYKAIKNYPKVYKEKYNEEPPYYITYQIEHPEYAFMIKDTYGITHRMSEVFKSKEDLIKKISDITDTVQKPANFLDPEFNTPGLDMLTYQESLNINIAYSKIIFAILSDQDFWEANRGKLGLFIDKTLEEHGIEKTIIYKRTDPLYHFDEIYKQSLSKKRKYKTIYDKRNDALNKLVPEFKAVAKDFNELMAEDLLKYKSSKGDAIDPGNKTSYKFPYIDLSNDKINNAISGLLDKYEGSDYFNGDYDDDSINDFLNDYFND